MKGKWMKIDLKLTKNNVSVFSSQIYEKQLRFFKPSPLAAWTENVIVPHSSFIETDTNVKFIASQPMCR